MMDSLFCPFHLIELDDVEPNPGHFFSDLHAIQEFAKEVFTEGAR